MPFPDDDQTSLVLQKLDDLLFGQSTIRSMLRDLSQQEKRAMTVQADIAAALAQLTTDVTAQTTVTASFVTYVQGIQAQLATIIASTTDTTTAAALTALDQQITTNTAADSAAITANTPASPTPTPLSARR
jgi:hypothetical protein